MVWLFSLNSTERSIDGKAFFFSAWAIWIIASLAKPLGTGCQSKRLKLLRGYPSYGPFMNMRLKDSWVSPVSHSNSASLNLSIHVNHNNKYSPGHRPVACQITSNCPPFLRSSVKELPFASAKGLRGTSDPGNFRRSNPLAHFLSLMFFLLFLFSLSWNPILSDFNANLTPTYLPSWYENPATVGPRAIQNPSQLPSCHRLCLFF